MSRLTGRDFKKPAKRNLNSSRLREFGAGAVTGALIATALVLYLYKPAPAPAESPRPAPQKSATVGQEPSAEETEGAGEYDFYEMLPNFEVVVPEKDREVKRDLPTAPIERPGVYVLQAGSYRNLVDADRIAKQLSLQGIDAKVQRVAVDNDVWHRVRIGPIDELRELNRLRQKLQAAEVDALVIRVGD